MTVLVLKVLGLAGALVLAGWLYWLTAKVLLLLTYAEQLFGMGAQLLGTVPGKSAERTLAALDEEPRRWWQTLRRLAELRDDLDQVVGEEFDEDLVEHAAEPADEDRELARWADDGGAGDDVAVEPTPPEALGPPTQPAARVLIDHLAEGVELPTTPIPRIEQDDIDRRLDAFTYAEGHHR